MSLILLLAGLIATAVLIDRTGQDVAGDRRLDFDVACDTVRALIAERMKADELILVSGAAFYDHADHISRDEWHRFVEELHVEQRYPGIQGVGYAQLVPRAALSQHLREIRAEGFPNYRLRPEGDRELYSAIVLLEPFTDRNLRAFGYDMLSEKTRRTAMETARDRGVPTLSGKVVLVQETTEAIQAGALIYVPVYRRDLPTASVAERRAALLGWVYSPYRMTDLMQAILEAVTPAIRQRVQVKVFDTESPSAATLLYDSLAGGPMPPGSASALTRQLTLIASGRPWTLLFTETAAAEATASNSAVWLAALGGLSTSLLLSGFLFALLTLRFQARQLAARLTAELRASEQQFRAIADYTVDLELWFGPNGSLLWVNSSVQRITGHSPAAALAAADFMASIATADDANTASLAALRQCLAQGETATDTAFRCLRKDGSELWLSLSWQPILDANGHSLGLRVSGRDVTRFRELEQELRRAHWVVEQSNTSIVITDRFANIEFVNAEFTRASGYAADEVLGQNPRVLKSGRTPPATYEAMWQSLTAGHSWRGEFVNRKKDGSLYWEAVAVTPLRDEAGNITHYAAIKQDVTELKQVQSELKVANERMRLAAQAGGPGTWDYDVVRGTLVWDERMLDLYGIAPDQFGGDYADWQQALHPDDRQRCNEEIQRALKGETDFDTEFRVVWPDGSLRDIRGLGVVQRDASGQALRMIGTNWDITAQKLRAAAVTAVLEVERQLERRLSESKSRFIAVTSHEFRTPMAVAMGAAELLTNHFDRLTPTKRTELLGRINDAMRRMTDMLDEVLLLDSVDAGRTEAQFAPVDLPCFLREAIDEARLSEHDGHCFEFEAAGDAAAFVTDANLLHHIVSNLLGNAVRYSPAGTVVSTRLDADARGVRIAVEDRGIGVPEADRARIFEPFERGSNIGTIKGTGLGLSIVQRMAALLDGDVSVVAAEGGGSCFTLVLPLRHAAAPPPPPHPSSPLLTSLQVAT